MRVAICQTQDVRRFLLREAASRKVSRKTGDQNELDSSRDQARNLPPPDIIHQFFTQLWPPSGKPTGLGVLGKGGTFYFLLLAESPKALSFGSFVFLKAS